MDSKPCVVFCHTLQFLFLYNSDDLQVRLGELECHLFAGQLLVDSRVRFGLKNKIVRKKLIIIAYDMMG